MSIDITMSPGWTGIPIFLKKTNLEFGTRTTRDNKEVLLASKSI